MTDASRAGWRIAPRRGAAAALLALAAGAAACSSRAQTPETPRGDAVAAAPATPLASVLHFADYGDDTRQQAAVAQAMTASHRRAPFDLAISPGDNVYQCGLDPALPGASACAFAPDANSAGPGYAPPHDPLMARRFERLLGGLSRGGAPIPIHPALGNHDVGLPFGCPGRRDPATQRTRACLQVAWRTPQWVMPGRHYAFDAGPARFLVIDSNLLAGDYGGFTIDGEVAFLAAQGAACARRPCFLVAHHPAATAGRHRDDFRPEYLARLARIEQAVATGGGRIAAWLCGHDHDLQHLRSAGGYDVFVSGNTSRGRGGETFGQVAPPTARLLFASAAWGFGRLEIRAAGWSYRFENDRGEPIHCCVAGASGPCRPVACAPER